MPPDPVGTLPALHHFVDDEGRLEPGTILDDKYLIIAAIGHGAMGYVYEAEHLVLLERVALKVLHPQYAENEVIRERLRLEARILARLKSEHLTRVLDANLSEKSPVYIVMEYVEGIDLAEYISDRLPLPVAEAVEIARQVCHGLESCHAQGIFHRDIKPENILLEQRPPRLKVRLIDFGIAKSSDSARFSVRTNTLHHTELGSPGYMAVEQRLDASRVDARADVYSLGVVLHELLTGRLPFDEEGHGRPLPLPQAPVQVSLQNPAVPRELSDIIQRCLRMDPEERYASATELRTALGAFAIRLRVQRSRPSADPRTPGAPAAAPPAPTSRDRLDSPSTEPLVTPIDGRTSRLGRFVSVLSLLGAIGVGLFVAEHVGATDRLLAVYPKAYEVVPAGLLPPRLNEVEVNPGASQSPDGRTVAVYSSITTLPSSPFPERARPARPLEGKDRGDSTDEPDLRNEGPSSVATPNSANSEPLNSIEEEDASVQKALSVEEDVPVDEPGDNPSGGLDLSSVPEDPVSNEP